MKLNDSGINLITNFEGCKLESYKDVGGIWTIGYGHTKEVHEGQRIVENHARQLLMQDLDYTCGELDKIIIYKLNDNQFSALVAFAFNVGTGALQKSTLLKYVNSGKLDLAANEFLKWDNVKGKPVEGLLRRREAEKALFLEKV